MREYTSLAQHYDILTEDVPYKAIADFYERRFAESGQKINTVLDIACGTGTMTRILSERGYEMIGVDSSAEMLSIAADKTGEMTKRPMYICQRIQELDLYGTIDAAICCLDGMNYVRQKEIKESLRRVWMFLEPDGILIFDIIEPWRFKELDDGVFIDERADVFCVWRAEYKEEEKKCKYGLDIFAKEGSRWRRTKEEHVEYAHEPEEIIEILRMVGFREVKRCGEEEVPRGVGARVYIEARK